MARLAVSTAFAAVGFAIGGPMGARIGWMAGTIVGGALFPEKNRIEGPRAGDLRVHSSAPGRTIPRFWGTVRLTGELIWSDEVKTIEVEETVGGKGGPENTSVTYRYKVSFAISLGQVEIDQVLKIWEESTVVYDQDTPALGGSPTDAEQINYYRTTKKGLRFRVYKGTETQLPDSIMEAVEGVGKVPGYRGETIVVFEKYNVTRQGGRIPNLSFMVTANATASSNVTEAGVAFIADPVYVDEKKGAAYWSRTDGLAVYDVETMKLRRVRPWAEVFTTYPLSRVTYFDGLGYGYGFQGSANRGFYTKVDLKTLTEVATWGDGGLNLWNEITGFTAPQDIAGNKSKGVAGRKFICALGQFGTLGILEVTDLTQLAYAWGDNESVGASTNAQGVCKGAATASQVDFYAVGSASNTIYWNHITLTTGGIAFGSKTQVSHGASDFVAGATTITSVGGPVWDELEDAVFITADIDGDQYLIRLDNAGAVDWAVSTEGLTASGFNIPGDNSSFGIGEIVIISAAGGIIARMDTATGDVLDSYSGLSITNDYNRGHWIGDTQAYFEVRDTSTNGLRRILANRYTGGGETLSTIVSDICSEVNLAAGDIDVTALTDVVPGFILSRTINATEALRALMQAYVFDFIETDYKIVGVKRGGASVATIAEVDMLAGANGAGPLQTTRGQEFELPEIVSLTYVNRDNQFLDDEQHSPRMRFPVPTMYSRTTLAAPIPVIETAQYIKRLAETMLYRAYVERTQYHFSTGVRHMRLDPGDVVTIAMNDGRTITARIVQTTFGTNFQFEFDAVAEDIETYTSTVTADAGTGVVEQSVAGPVETMLALLDTPLLRDVDSPGNSIPVQYFSLSNYSEGSWPGGHLFKSNDDLVYGRVSGSNSPATWGYTQSALGDWPYEKNSVDYTNTLTVGIIHGGANMASVTFDQLMAGANMAAILKANGEVEVFGFQTVVQTADNTFALSNLMRGQRGTDTMARGHAISDIFVLLTEATLRVLAVALTEVNAARYYKAVGNGQLLEDVDAEILTSAGRSLMPYAVVHQVATRNGSDIDLAWTRRTRIGGAWIDGDGTNAPGEPLSEDSEAYEIDIYDADQATILRAITGITSPSYKYLSADIVTDFGLATTAHPPTLLDLTFEAGTNNQLVEDVGLWTVSETGSGGMRYRNDVVRSGSIALAHGNAHNDHWCWQTVELVTLASGEGLLMKIDAGLVTFSWSGYIYGDGDNVGYLRARWLDADQVELQLDASTGITANDAWALDTVSGSIPAAARYVRWECFGDHISNGIAHWNWWDDLNQPTITSPAWTGADVLNLDARIVQLNDAVGRGFSRIKNFEIVV